MASRPINPWKSPTTISMMPANAIQPYQPVRSCSLRHGSWPPAGSPVDMVRPPARRLVAPAWEPASRRASPTKGDALGERSEDRGCMEPPVDIEDDREIVYDI